MDYGKARGYCEAILDEAKIIHSRIGLIKFYLYHYNPPIPESRIAVEMQQAISSNQRITELMESLATEMAGK